MTDKTFLENIKDNSMSAKEKYLGPSYDYVKNIKLPSEMNMGSKGNLPQLGRDINGLIGYVELLVSGGGKASVRKGPMGNKFFLLTGAKCKATDTDSEVDRYMYINNIPTGNIPFISAGMGVNFTSFRGLVPGTMEQLNNFNPLHILTAFMGGLTPKCQPLTMEVVDVNNNRTQETHYVTLADINNMDPCIFPGKTNVSTGVKCRETFSNMNVNTNTSIYGNDWEPVTPKDTISQIYFASLGTLGIYITFKALQKMDLLPK
jgi:hypothetical protein